MNDNIGPAFHATTLTTPSTIDERVDWYPMSFNEGQNNHNTIIEQELIQNIPQSDVNTSL